MDRSKMYSFDGDYRRRPMQSLGGASFVSDRDTIIKKAQEERQKRNELRRQNNGATIIQAHTKSFLIRQHVKQIERTNFDNFWTANKDHFTTNIDSNIDVKLSYLIPRLLFFYSKNNFSDCERLVNICKILIKKPENIMQNCTTQPIWLHRIKKLLLLCLEQLTVPNNLNTIKQNQQQNISVMPLRTLETYTSDELIKKILIRINQNEFCVKYFQQLYEYLINHNYFGKLRLIIEDKCPPLNDDNIIENLNKAPNQITDALYQMIIHPLILINNNIFSTIEKYHEYRICNSFVKNFLSNNFSNCLIYFLLPCFANHQEFPFTKIITSICSEFIYTWNDDDDNNEIIDPNESGDKCMKMIIDNEDENQMKDDSKKIFTTFLLYSILNLDKRHFDKLSNKSLLSGYIKIISLTLPKIHLLSKTVRHQHKIATNSGNGDDEDDDDDDDDDDDNNDEFGNEESNRMSSIEKDCLLKSIDLLNESERVNVITKNIDLILNSPSTLHSLCKICHELMIYNKTAIYDYKLLYTLACIPKFLRAVWFTLALQSSQMGFSSPLSLLSKGVVPKADVDINRTIPLLATFCALFSRLVPTLHDGEFCEGNNFFMIQQHTLSLSSTCEQPLQIKSLMPFTLNEIVQLSKTLKEISLGLVELAFPETKTNLNLEHYRSVFINNTDDITTSSHHKHTKQIWTNLLKVVVSVLNQIYTRDLRRNFCPDGHWIIHTVNLPLDRPNDLPLTRSIVNRRNRYAGLRPFQPIRDFTREDYETNGGPPMSTKQIRSITILREIPFVVSFNTRVSILQGLIAADKIRVQGDLQGFLQGPSIQLVVRRSYLYEDAYDKLRPENEPDLRHKFRVQFINNFNLEEAGIDGGGLFREFLTELIKTAFDPNRGFFMVTTDNKLYPNPSVGDLIQDFEKHYYFMGRILGKAIYENLLVELPLADFFLSKLAGKYSDVDVHQLASLDPVLYRNLLSLKEYEGDVSELGLDFTVVNNNLGTTKIQELKPNGQSITVTSSNRIEYIQLMADYKLNKQIRQHCIAFRKGLSNVLPVEWLYMFSNKELQILISGAEIPINLDDLKMHCRYGGEYSPTHPTIQCFWKVVEEFTDLQKRQLLKFVTSCSRPPLLGFKDLDPPFLIQNAGDEERLPTASTCTNLLKLPAFKTIEQMREKLLFAIQAGAGFDLS